MKQDAICPFFGKNEDECDVGCGYISPHDVRVIISYCSARHSDCLKYRELSERHAVAAVSGTDGPRRRMMPHPHNS